MFNAYRLSVQKSLHLKNNSCAKIQKLSKFQGLKTKLKKKNYKNTSFLFKNKFKLKKIFLLFGFKVKPNNRFAFWNSFNTQIINCSLVKNKLNDSNIENITESVCLTYSSQIMSISSLEKKFNFKTINILFFKLKGFFFYNFIGSIFNKLNFYLQAFGGKEIFIFIKFFNLYNKDKIWGKKRCIKKTKLRFLIQKNKKNSMFRDNSIIN